MRHKLLTITPYTLLLTIQDFISPLLPFFGLMVVVVLVDLRFGVVAARKRCERIKFSQMVRRTISKFADYSCWIFLAVVFDSVITTPLSIPLFRYICLLIVFSCEIESCFTNYFESRGKKIKIRLFDFFKKKIDLIDIEPENKDHEIK